MKRFWLAILEGTTWTLIGVLVCWLCLPTGWYNPMKTGGSGLFGADFARRWDGGCRGWTRGLATVHIVGDLMHWWAYTTASFILLRLHPIMDKIKGSRMAVYTMCLFIFGCGITHLWDAYASIYPVYRAFGWLKICNGMVSIAGAVLIAYTLVQVFAVVTAKRKRLEALEATLAGQEA